MKKKKLQLNMQIENPMAITIIKNVMRVNTSFYQ